MGRKTGAEQERRKRRRTGREQRRRRRGVIGKGSFLFCLFMQGHWRYGASRQKNRN